MESIKPLLGNSCNAPLINLLGWSFVTVPDTLLVIRLDLSSTNLSEPFLSRSFERFSARLPDFTLPRLFKSKTCDSRLARYDSVLVLWILKWDRRNALSAKALLQTTQTYEILTE